MESEEESPEKVTSNDLLDKQGVKEAAVGVSPMLEQLTKPLIHDILYSLVHYRSGSMDLTPEEIESCTPSRIKRIVSTPYDDKLALCKCSRTLKLDCSQTMRERAIVLPDMHWKVSDSSSIAESLPHSPPRLSKSASDSSRFIDHTSSRSGHAVPKKLFDKLSSDLDISHHGLDSLADELKFESDRIGQESLSLDATGRLSTVDEQRIVSKAISISS